MGGFVEELFPQRGLGIGGLCHDKQTTGILVDAMDEPHLGIIRIIALQIFQVPGNSVHQRTIEITAPRMYHHPRRFVDHHQIIVFIHHLKWDILGLDGCIIVRTVEHQGDDIARANLIITLYRTTIYMDEARISRFLDTVTAGMWLMFGQILVDTDRYLSFVHFHPEMLIELIIFYKIHHSTTSSNSSGSPSCMVFSSGSM